MRALARFAPLLLAAAPAVDPLEAAHARRDPAHAMTVVQVESEIEDLTKGTITVFGSRREIRCPGGEVVRETRCDPCTYTRAEWAEHPANEWILEASYATEAEHEEAARMLAHFGTYFELEPRPGVESAGRQHVFMAYTGHLKAPPPPPMAAKVKLRVGTVERDTALIPAGGRDVEIVAQPFRRNPSGALEPMPSAEVSFATPCATLRSTGPGRILASLAPGTPSCAVTATANPGGAQATINVSREVKVDILFEGQAADEVRLQHDHGLELTFRASALDRPIAIHPEWRGEHGTFEIHDGGKQVRFTLDPGANEGTVLLLDSNSGASDTLAVKRQP